MNNAAKDWDGDTVVGIGLVALVVTVLRNEEFRFGNVKYPSEEFQGRWHDPLWQLLLGKHLNLGLRNDHWIYQISLVPQTKMLVSGVKKTKSMNRIS